MCKQATPKRPGAGNELGKNADEAGQSTEITTT
jgi:hypothetical protein